MAFFIDDKQHFTIELTDGADRLAVSFRLMAAADVQAVLVRLDKDGPHYDPSAAYELGIPKVAGCVLAITHNGNAVEVSEDMLKGMPLAHWATLRNAAMGLDPSIREEIQEREKN